MTVAPRDATTGLRANVCARSAPIEVMHVITSLDVGGAETMLAQLVASDTSGTVSHGVVSLKPGGALRASLEDAGIPVTDVGVGRRRGALTGLVRLAGLIRSRRPAVVHTWLYHADLLATLALLLSGRWRATRLVWGVRCSDMDMRRYSLGTRGVLKLLPLLSPRTDLVLCNSDAGRAVHERLGYRPPRWRVIPNGVDVERFRPRPGERAAIRAELGLDDLSFAVGMCARVDPMKDHDNFVKAAAMFAEAEPEARFVLVGAGTDKPGSTLHQAIAASGIAARFVCLGQRQDIGRIHSALDVATLSSAFGEGFPNVLAEAMACGVPCVATDVGDSASIIGDTGLVVPPGNAEALSAAWDRLRHESCEHRAIRGAAARRRVTGRYALGTMIEAYRTQYRECVLSRGARDDERSVPPKPLDDPLAREAEPTPDSIDAHQPKRPGGSRTRFGVRTAAVVAATAVCMALAFRTVDVGAVGQALGESQASLRGPRRRPAPVQFARRDGKVSRRARRIRLRSCMATADCRFLRRPARKPVRSQHHRAKRRPGGRLDLQRRAVRRDDHRNVRGARPCRGCTRCRRCGRGMASPAATRHRFRAGRRLLHHSGSRNGDGRMRRKRRGLASRGIRAVDHSGVASLGAILVSRAADGVGPCLHARRICLGVARGWSRIADSRGLPAPW